MAAQRACLPIALGLVLSAAPLAQGAEPARSAIEVSVDPRVELVSVVYRLSGSFEYCQPSSSSPYAAEVDRYFAEFAEHPVVGMARSLREQLGIGFNAPPSLVLHIEDLSSWKERVPFDPRPEWMDERWTPAAARAFSAALREFAADSAFDDFYAGHAELRGQTEGRMRALLSERLRREWFAAFFGHSAGSLFRVHPGLLLGGCNYGTGVRWPDGREELTPCIGCWKFDAEGVPVFDAEFLPTVVHEFCHCFVNPLIERHLALLEPAAARIFRFHELAMRDLAYGQPRIVLNESLVRACVVRYLAAHEGSESAREQARSDVGIGFAWVPELSALLGEYERERSQHATLDAFAPRIARFFEETAAALEKLYADAPRVLRTVPANGAEDVDPGLRELQIEFDRPMLEGSWAVMGGGDSFPPIDASRAIAYDAAGKVLTVPVALAPGHAYRYGLNSPSKHGFKSRAGAPLVPLRVEFRTAAR